MIWRIGLCLWILAAADPVPAETASYDMALQDWARILARYVDDEGRVDFVGLAAGREELDRFVEFIAAYSPASHPQMFPEHADQLAYHINAYNALAMHAIIESDIPDNLDGFFKRLSFFKLHDIIVGGEATSLYDYENDAIRPLGEDRVHFALNCMVRGCPRLPREPFRAGNLERQLQAVTEEFFSTEKHIRVDAAKETVYLSWIMDNYREDFVDSGKPRDLIPYINRHRSPPLPEHYRVKFLSYDWTVNRQP